LESGQTLRTFEGHADQVNALAVTPDGLCAVSGSKDCTMRVWDLETGQTLHILKGHTGSVTVVTVTPNGRWVVSGGCDRTL
jgi:WD40 repeat protein